MGGKEYTVRSSYGPGGRKNLRADDVINFSRLRPPLLSRAQSTLLPNGRKLRSHARRNGAGKRRLQTSGRAGSSTQRQEAAPFFSHTKTAHASCANGPGALS